MTNARERMSEKARSELIEAIKSDRIGNATQYAEEFAAQRGLNPATVRSSISRLRRELGMLKRRPRRPNTGERVAFRLPPDIHVLEPSMNALTLLMLRGATDPTVARLSAAVLLLYENDDEFRRAVDEQRPEVEKIGQRVNELREFTEELSSAERAEVARFLESS